LLGRLEPGDVISSGAQGVGGAVGDLDRVGGLFGVGSPPVDRGGQLGAQIS
jgi:hypothetical protein